MGVIQQDPTPDFNPDMLMMLTYLMLAQAQEVFVIKAQLGKIFAKLLHSDIINFCIHFKWLLQMNVL